MHNFYANGAVSFRTGSGSAVDISNAGVITGDGGGLSNVSATATPAGFADSVQYNDGGTALGGDSVFTYSSSTKQLSLSGAAAGAGGISLSTSTMVDLMSTKKRLVVERQHLLLTITMLVV